MPDINTLSTLLRDKKMLLVTAESCTGGLIAASITDIAGSSEIFDRGFVTYSNQAKKDMLGVSNEILQNHGAVSSTCAQAMVLGALENSSSDIAVSVTGIAGPSGGTAEKPVGLVYIGICIQGGQPVVEECQFKGSRDDIRKSSVEKAINLLIKSINSPI